MALLRYRAEEARNIAKAKQEAERTARIEGSLAKKLADTDIASLQSQIDNIDKSSVGLSNVDNTSDADKPVSDATQDALDLKASAADLAAKLEWSAAPATATSPGTAGQIAYDSSFIYVCVATDTWVRSALTTW